MTTDQYSRRSTARRDADGDAPAAIRTLVLDDGVRIHRSRADVDSDGGACVAIAVSLMASLRRVLHRPAAPPTPAALVRLGSLLLAPTRPWR